MTKMAHCQSSIYESIDFTLGLGKCVVKTSVKADYLKFVRSYKLLNSRLEVTAALVEEVKAGSSAVSPYAA